MPNEDDHLSRRNTLALVQVPERPALSLRVQHQQVVYPLKVLLCRQIVVDLHIAREVQVLLL